MRGIRRGLAVIHCFGSEQRAIFTTTGSCIFFQQPVLKPKGEQWHLRSLFHCQLKNRQHHNTTQTVINPFKLVFPDGRRLPRVPFCCHVDLVCLADVYSVRYGCLVSMINHLLIWKPNWIRPAVSAQLARLSID